MLKRIFALLTVCAVLITTLSGCSYVGIDTDTLLTPPRPSGDLYQIQQTLNNSVTEKFTLKYPISGDYRSAIVQKDLNGDGTEEALAFYSTVNDNTVTMHILLIVKDHDEWVSRGDFKCVATGVETVNFCDMDADGVMEILVGWTVYGNVDKALGVYSLRNGNLMQRINESYNNFICADLNDDGKSEIFLINLNQKEDSAMAKFIALTDSGTELLGTAPLSPNVTGYASPIVSKLPNGNTAIYVDAVKGAGVITEVLEFKNGSMINALQNENLQIADTFRSGTAAARDIDADGITEIPLTSLITQAEDSNDNVYRTDWCVVKDNALEIKLSALMNYADGYYIIIPDKWADRITVTRDTANRIRTIMKIDEETGNSADVLLKLQTLPVTEDSATNTAAMPNGVKIAETDELYFLANVSDYSGDEAVTLDEFKNYFKILGK